MTNDNTTANDSSKQKTSTRRKVLKGIGAVGIGAGLGVGGVYTIADQSDHVDTTDFTGPEQPEKAPEGSEPDDTTPPRTTPWNKENIVFSIDRADNISGDTHVPVQLNKAAEFWNDYIENNVQFDLTLTFEPNHSNPDILFIQENIVDCLGEYRSLPPLTAMTSHRHCAWKPFGKPRRKPRSNPLSPWAGTVKPRSDSSPSTGLDDSSGSTSGATRLT